MAKEVLIPLIIQPLTDAVQAYLDGTAGTGGDAAGDTLTNIENLIGSAYADTLFGDDAENVLAGGDWG